MKRKKLWIIILSIVAGIVAVITGGYFMTKLSSVSVEFRTRLGTETRLEEGIIDKVKNSGEFNYKASVLFLDTQKSVDKIEKEHPYVKVHQVLRKFPNKLCIYIEERIPKYRVKDTELSNKWYILDDEFKVLEFVTTDELNENFVDSTVEIQYFKASLGLGEFLKKDSELQRLNSIMAGVYGKTKDYFAVTAINYSADEDKFYLTTKSDDYEYSNTCEIQIVGSNNLTDKTFKAMTVFVEKNFEGIDIDLSKKIIIISDNDGCKIKNI